MQFTCTVDPLDAKTRRALSELAGDADTVSVYVKLRDKLGFENWKPVVNIKRLPDCTDEIYSKILKAVESLNIED